MGHGRSRRVRTYSWLDIVSLIFGALVVVVSTLSCLQWLPQDGAVLTSITERLGNTAGIVSALSLAGLTFAGVGGKAQIIFQRFSRTLATFFALSYFVVVILALLCAFAPAWTSHERFLAGLVGATLGLMIVVVAGTTFVLFGLLHQTSESPAKVASGKAFTPTFSARPPEHERRPDSTQPDPPS